MFTVMHDQTNVIQTPGRVGGLNKIFGAIMSSIRSLMRNRSNWSFSMAT